MFGWFKKKNMNEVELKDNLRKALDTIDYLEKSFMHISSVYQARLIEYDNVVRSLVLMNGNKVTIPQGVYNTVNTPEIILNTEKKEDYLILTLVENKQGAEQF